MLTASCHNQTTCPDAFTPQEAYDRMQTGNGLLLDVRGYDEFTAGHATSALCLPLPDLERRAAQIPTDRPVLLMCASGTRSRMAYERLCALGFTNVIDVPGGFAAWERAGLPVQKQRGVIPLERQVRGIAGALVFTFTLLALFVNSGFLYGALFIGFMLLLSGLTGMCPMLSLLNRMPWNRVVAQSARMHAGS